MPTYIRSKINTDLPVEITLNSEGSETILNQDGTFKLPGVGSNGIGSLRVIDTRVEVKLSTGEWKQILVSPDLSPVALSGLFSDLVSTPTTISGYGITDAYTKTQVDTGISTAINNLVDSAPDLLNTLNELSQALNNDANYAATITSSLNGKLNLSGGTLTGALTLSANPTSSLHAATKQYVDTYVNNATASVAIDTYTTDNLEEGNNNLYYTDARVNNAFDARLALKSTSDLTEGTNKYYTDARARAAVSVAGSGSYDSTTGVITVTGGVTSVNGKTGAVILGTGDIEEGTNKYYTDARARAAVSVAGSGSYDSTTGVITVTGGVTSVNGKTGAVSISTSDISEGTNLYYTDARSNSAFDTRLAAKSTTNVTEGNNLYYTDARARTAIGVSGSLSYNSSTGVISYSTPNTDAISEGTTNRYFTSERARLSVSAGTGISYSSDTGIIAVNTGVIATKNDLTTTNVTEGTNLYYTIDRTKDDGFATKAYLDGQIAQVSLNVINTIDNVNAFMKTTAITTATLITLVDSITAPSFAQSDWNETDPNKLDYIRNKPNLSGMTRDAISVSGSLSYNSSTGVISYTTPSTSGILEGTNLYFTNTRARAALRAGTGISYDNSTGVITNAITQYTDTMAKAVISATGDLSYNSSTGVINFIQNKAWSALTGIPTTISGYGITDAYTKTQVDNAITTAVAGKDNTDEITEGTTNKYFTDARARAAISAGDGINYNSSTGIMSLSSIITVDGGDITFDGNSTDPESNGGSSGGSFVAQIQSDWTATTGLAQILNKPTLSTVATSGRYDDLIGSPLPYDLPKSTTTRLGGVKVDGTSIISTDGVLSVASTLNGSLTGNASTASKLATARTINGVSFDGSANITVKATATNALTIGAGLSGTSYDGSSAVTIANTGVTSIAGTSGQISASASTGGITLSLPNSMTVPGSLTVTGNLTVSGTTTTINSNILSVADLNIEVAKNAATAADANNAGLIVVGANAALLYTSTDDRWNLNKGLNVSRVYGNVTGNVTGNVSGSAGSINWSNISGLPTFASSATTDTTNASNITTGVLSNSRLSAIPNSALANSSITINGQSVNLGGNLTVSAQASNALTIGSYLTGNSYNGSTAVTIAVDAASANTVSKIVARDSSGNFSAGTITANLTGNASTASKLATARTINGVSFDGSANVTVHTAGTGIGISGTTVTNLLATSGGAIGGNIAVTGDITATGDVVSSGGNFVGDLIGNASTATTLQNTRTISGVNFNGSANITLITTGITEGTNLYYTDARARAAVSFTAGSGAYNSTTGVFTIPTNNNQLANGAGYITGITGNNVITALGYTPYGASNPSGYTTNTGTVTSISGGSYLTGGTITTSGTLAVDATSANTASKVVARDASGNFSAGTITAGLNGNASTASTLQTARNINGVSFNGSGDVVVHTAGTGISISGTTVTNALATSGGTIGGAIAVTGSITATGDVTAYYSDARLKTEVESITDPISKVMSLRGVTFRPNQTALDLGITDREEVGVIAQEVETVLPQLVVESGYEGYKTVKYDKLTALLIEAVKNQQVQIDELKQEIQRLKNG